MGLGLLTFMLLATSKPPSVSNEARTDLSRDRSEARAGTQRPGANDARRCCGRNGGERCLTTSALLTTTRFGFVPPAARRLWIVTASKDRIRAIGTKAA